MTLAELRSVIKTEARVKTGTNLDAFITDVIQELLRDYGNRARYREMLAIDEPITLVDEQAQYALPADFQHLHNVRYSIEGTVFRPLYPFNEGQLRINEAGHPRYFELFEGGIMFYPAREIRASNTLYLSYYRDPAAVYTTEDAVFPIPRLEPAVKKATIARVVRYMQQLPESDRVATDAERSVVSAQGGS